MSPAFERIRPPADLSAAERSHFRKIVASRRPHPIAPGQAALIAQLARHHAALDDIEAAATRRIEYGQMNAGARRDYETLAGAQLRQIVFLAHRLGLQASAQHLAIAVAPDHGESH